MVMVVNGGCMSADKQVLAGLGRTLALALLLAFVTACSKTVKWTEEVQLSDGQVLIVERSTHFRPGGGEIVRSSGWKPEYSVIRFRYPSDSSKVVEWRTTRYDAERHSWPELPLVFDIEPGSHTPFLITSNGGTKTGCSEYFRYRYEKNIWRDDTLPEIFQARPANLFLGSSRTEITNPVSLSYKQKENTDSRYSEIHRIVGPDRCVCGHRGNSYKGGCTQNYRDN